MICKHCGSPIFTQRGMIDLACESCLAQVDKWMEEQGWNPQSITPSELARHIKELKEKED